MRIVVVPNDLRDAINAKLDAALAECPEAAPDREHFYDTLLNYYDEHGSLPDFHLAKYGPCEHCGGPTDREGECPKCRDYGGTDKVLDEDWIERSQR